MKDFIDQLVLLIDLFGYTGVFITSVIEGTLIPIPNELTLIPAGYLASKGSFHLLPLFIVAILGNLIGCFISYFIGFHYGRAFIMKYGYLFLLSKKKIKKIDIFFEKYGTFSVLIGRIAPGLKHFISIPAGLAKMNFLIFSLYSLIGGAVWVSFLITLGYFIGDNAALISKYISYFNGFFGIILCLFIIFICFKIFKSYERAK